jgi:hypothetical protein
VNFLRRLAFQEKKLDGSSRLDVVEIARFPDMLPRFFPPFLVWLRTYQHPDMNSLFHYFGKK